MEINSILLSEARKDSIGNFKKDKAWEFILHPQYFSKNTSAIKIAVIPINRKTLTIIRNRKIPLRLLEMLSQSNPNILKM